LFGNFENEYGDFLTATKPSPSDVERDEVNEDIPARFFTNITVAGGWRQDKIDTGAFAICVSPVVHREIGTEPLAKGGDANAAEGRALPVLGSGRILLGLWGRTYDVPVRVMRTLPTGILIGRRFLIKHGVDLDFASLRGSFHKVIRGRRAVLSGRLRADSGPEGEEVAVMQEAGLADVIEKMDLADLGEEFEAKWARCCSATSKSSVDLARPRERNSTSRSHPTSTCPSSTLLSIVGQRRRGCSKGTAGNQEQRTATDHRKINQATE
jgi:hypothetical protein